LFCQLYLIPVDILKYMNHEVKTLFYSEDESDGVNEGHPMSALSAVEALLTEIGKPIDCAEITRGVLKRKLWTSNGKTPAATISAQLAVDIKKHGTNSRFQRTAPSVFGLRA
jgi:hypothetical protein